MEFPWIFLLKYGQDLEVLSIFWEISVFFLGFWRWSLHKPYLDTPFYVCLVTFLLQNIAPGVGNKWGFQRPSRKITNACVKPWAQRFQRVWEKIRGWHRSDIFGGPVVNSISESHFGGMLIIFIVTIESWFFSKVLWGSRIPLVFLLAIGQASFQSGSIKEKRHRMGLQHHPSLVCGLEHLNYVFHILRIVILTDFHIFHRGWNHQPDHRNIRSPSDSSDFVPCKLVYKPHELYVVRYIHHRSPYIYIYIYYMYIHIYIYILLISPVNTIVISTINLWFFSHFFKATER